MDYQQLPEWNEQFFSFVKQHLGEDAMRLRLKKHTSTDFSLELAITQIEARGRRLEKKIPDWYAHERVVFPSLLSTEQCSSQETAMYKQRLVKGRSLCDLTGGLGIDTYYMARCVDEAVYVEQNALYCHVARHNFAELGLNHITVYNSDCNLFLSEQARSFDTIFIDPARRGKSHERLYALADCEPNVLEMMPMLLARCKRLIIKLSPMVDMSMLRQEIGRPCHLYVVSLNNECKEILAVIDTEQFENKQDECDVTCAVIGRNTDVKELSFCYDHEPQAPCPIATEAGAYLYEPDTALLKAGMFRSLCNIYNVEKLHKNSHLYTSQVMIDNFAGRSFKIIEVLPFSSSLCKGFAKQYSACNITTRNFPLSAVELRKKLRLRDGGELYLFATTLADNSHVLIICNKA